MSARVSRDLFIRSGFMCFVGAFECRRLWLIPHRVEFGRIIQTPVFFSRTVATCIDLVTWGCTLLAGERTCHRRSRHSGALKRGLKRDTLIIYLTIIRLFVSLPSTPARLCKNTFRLAIKPGIQVVFHKKHPHLPLDFFPFKPARKKSIFPGNAAKRRAAREWNSKTDEKMSGLKRRAPAFHSTLVADEVYNGLN